MDDEEAVRIQCTYAVESPLDSDTGRTLAHTCIPRMFATVPSAAVLLEKLAGFPLPVAEYEQAALPAASSSLFGTPLAAPAVAGPSCRELPASVFPPAAVFGPRPDTLPEGFFLRQTPVDVANCVSINKKGRQCKLLYNPNLYELVMGPGYRPIFGRYIRRLSSEAAGPTAHEWIYLECMFMAYSIAFHNSMLNAPGVRFYPTFVPTPAGDVNFWARSVTDYIGFMNTVPPMPPGVCATFGRLPGALSVKQTKVPGNKKAYVLSSKYGPAHPIVQGKCLFPPLEAAPGKTSDPSYQDGGVAYVVYRMNRVEMGFQDEADQPGQPVAVYARLAFGPLALAPVAVQRAAIFHAVRYALFNTPRLADGRTSVLLDTCHHGQGEADFGYVTQCTAAAFPEVAPTINAVHVGDQTTATLARWVHRQNPGLTFSDCMAEARYQQAYAAEGGDGAVLLGGRVRTFAAEELEPVRALVARARQHAEGWHSLTAASPTMYYLAPPDEAAFGALPVVVLGFVLRVVLGAERTSPTALPTPPQLYDMYKTVSDLVTRFMWDMMFFSPQLVVVSTQKETLMSLFTEKAPGMLNVWSGKTGLPSRTTSTSKSRRIKNPHVALSSKVTPFIVETSGVPMAVPPVQEELPLQEHAVPWFFADLFPPSLQPANANPLVRLLVRGPPLPSGVPGAELSVYKAGTKAGATEWAGTCHSWTVHPALVEACLLRPRCAEFPWGYFGPEVGPAARQAAIDVLFAPLYNSVRGQNWKLEGHWRTPGFARRVWKTAYGVTAADMHRAMAFLMYPAFPGEYATPATITIWALKQKCEAFLQWMSRFGRIERGVLQNLRRRVRCDVPFVIRNYVYQVGQRVPGAPIADLLLSGYNAFSKCLILGGDLQAPSSAALPSPEAAPAVPVDIGTMVDTGDTGEGSYVAAAAAAQLLPFVMEEITTSAYHDSGLLAAPNDADEFIDYGEDDEEEEEEGGTERGGHTAPNTLSGLAFATSTAATPFLASLCTGPETLALMRELAAYCTPMTL